jgi:hypothetical protein
MDVHHANDSFQFDKLLLTSPNGVTGGSYLTKYTYYNSKTPLYIQTAKTASKQGIVVNGKKAHIDLLFTNDDSDFIEWIANLEKRSIELLYEKRHLWFTQELDQNDIENSFTSPIRAFKSGSYLVRVNLELNRQQTHIQPFLCKVFDDKRRAVPVDYVKPEHHIMSIIEFQGIKFTSRSFQLELILRQVLVVPDSPLFETCVITTSEDSNNSNNSKTANSSHSSTDPIISGHPLIPNAVASNVDPDSDSDSDVDLDAGSGSDYLGKQGQQYLIGSHVDDPPQTNSGALKHFDYTEIDIDFKDISDTIDVAEPTFDIENKSNGTSNGISNGTSATICFNTDSTPDATNITQNNHNSKTNDLWKKSTAPITLKKHKDVIYEMYKVAKRKAQEAKRVAIRAYLEAKEIKASYLLDDLDDFDSESDTSSDT